MAIQNSLFGSSARQQAPIGGQDFLLPELSNTVTTAKTTTPLRPLFSGNTANVLSGLQAGQSTPTGTGIGSSLLSGGLAAGVGFAAGGPVGAVVGGVASLINSFISVKKENKRKREMKRLIKEIEEKRARAAAQTRSDNFLQLKFNRKDTERNQAINAFSTKRQLLFNAINNNPILKQRFIQTGVL